MLDLYSASTMFPQNQLLEQMRRRRAFEPPFATPPIALQEEAEQSKSDPWSERLPDGRTVNEAIMQTLQREQSPATFMPLQNQRPPRDINSLPDAIAANEDLERSLRGPMNAKTPEGVTLSTGQETRPSIVGGSRDPNPLTREASRIQTMIQNPTRQVNPDGSAGVAHPMGRLKGALLGALFGLAQGDRNTSLAERLAGGGAGAAVGAFKPRAVQEWRRRMEVDDAQSQLGQQTKLAAGQAQLENLRAETQSRMADLMLDPQTGQLVKRPPRRAPQYVERPDGVYEISETNPNGRRIGNIPAEVKARGRGSVHYETRDDGVYAIYEDADGQIKSTKVPGVPGKPASDTQAAAAAEGESIAASTEQAASELRTTLDQQKGQLMKNERAIAQKESIWNAKAAKIVADSAGDIKLPEALAQVKAADPDFVSGSYAQTVTNTEALRKAVADGDKQLGEMAQEIRKGRAKGARGSRSSSSRGRYSGMRISRAKLPEAAKRLNMTVEQAEKYITDQQGVIY